MERECLAAQVRQALMVAPISTFEASSAPTTEANMAASFAHAGITGTRSTTVTTLATTLRFEGFRYMQSPHEFLEGVQNFRVMADITSGDRVRRLIATALDGSAKLWYRFAGPFDSWDAFADASRKEFASVEEKLRLKEEVDRRTQHPEEILNSEWVGSVARRRATWEAPEQVVGSARRKEEPTPSQIRANYVRDAHSSALLGHTGCPAREIRPPRVATLKNESGTAARPLAPAASLPGAARWLAALKLRAAPAMAGARTAEQQRASGRDELPGPGMRAARLPSQGTRARRHALATRR
ncbi:hypothetical protein HPB49_004784 [Dermacentor silvarum]|uniref:Uncharacterized protein n=1 Tax=Dermacentor silvarum TaxID=543639 RepID=A0ACB8DV29_DERSI|nr:hypothetical protein HPB49_004784 [Dermacentor silvarum]